jgi:hypothetical protein
MKHEITKEAIKAIIRVTTSSDEYEKGVKNIPLDTLIEFGKLLRSHKYSYTVSNEIDYDLVKIFINHPKLVYFLKKSTKDELQNIAKYIEEARFPLGYVLRSDVAKIFAACLNPLYIP